MSNDDQTAPPAWLSGGVDEGLTAPQDAAHPRQKTAVSEVSPSDLDTAAAARPDPVASPLPARDSAQSLAAAAASSVNGAGRKVGGHAPPESGTTQVDDDAVAVPHASGHVTAPPIPALTADDPTLPAAGAASRSVRPSTPASATTLASPDTPDSSAAPGVAGDHQRAAVDGPQRLTIDELGVFRPAKRPARRGWRRWVYLLSGKKVNPGESPAEIATRQLVERVQQPTRGVRHIAVLSLKGGVGKTTTTGGLGATFASVRGDRVIAVDANPDLGTLAMRGRRENTSTVRDLLADENLDRYTDVRVHTNQGESRLEILASEQDPAKAELFDETDYRDTLSILDVHYSLVLADTGTGTGHSAMRGVLGTADALIVIAAPARDTAGAAEATLRWLTTHGYENLVSRSVVVVNSIRPGKALIDYASLERVYLGLGVRAVHAVPFDKHLAEGQEIDLALLRPATRRAYLELAALVADDFSHNTTRAHNRT